VQRWYNSTSAAETTPSNETLPANVAVSPQANFYYDAHTSTSPLFGFQSQDSSKGRLTAVTYGASSTEGDYYRYDSLGRVFAKIQRIGSKDFQVSAQFNKADEITLLTYPSNRSVTNTFDAAGRLDSMTGNLGNTQKTYSTGILYTPNGSLTKEQFGTNKAIYSELSYNLRQQLVEISARTTDSTAPNRGKITNRYSLQCSGIDCTDNNGNLRKQEMYIPGDDQDQASARTTWYQQYDYDDLNRLARVQEYTSSTNQIWQQEYDYDIWGNRTINQNAAKTWGANIPKPDYHVDPANNNRLTAPTGKSLQYDVAGNVTLDTFSGSGTRKYDAENRMTEWGDPNGSYSYDANGRRVRRKQAGVETWQIYGLDGELLAEYPVNGAQDNPTKEYGYRNGQLLITAESGNGLAAPVFADNFDDNLFDASFWTRYYAGAPTVSEQSSQLQVAFSPNTAAYNGVYSNSTYDLTGRMVQVEVPQVISQAGWCENYLQVELDANNYFMIQVGVGTLLLRSRVNGVNDQTTIPFDSTAHKFWRIRHDQNANVIYFETSANDTVWIIRKTVTPGFSLTSLRIDLFAGCYGTGNSSPGTVKYDNVKLLSSTAGSTSLTIPNAGFEAPAVGNGSFQYSPTGGSWTFVNGGGVSGMNSGFTGSPSSAPEGVQIAFLQATGEISQSISGFQANTNYVISFSAAQRSNCCNTGGQDIQVYLDSDLKGTFHPTSGSYAEYSTANFTTTAGSHVVKFVGLNPLGGDHTAFIDNVRINGSPKPGYGIQWLVTDQLGTPRMVFDESGGLNNVKRHDYLPFGEEIAVGVGIRTAGLGYSASDGVRQQFTQKERDTETGLDYFLARYYSSTQGRFTSPDEFSGGPDELFYFANDASENPTFYADLRKPQSLNKYQYSYNNPLRWVDPDGHDPEEPEPPQDPRPVVPLPPIPGMPPLGVPGPSISTSTSQVPNDATIIEGTKSVLDTICDYTGITALAEWIRPRPAPAPAPTTTTPPTQSQLPLPPPPPIEVRGGNKLKPDPKAQGPHSTFKTDPKTGKVTGYTTWTPNPSNPSGFDPRKRVDVKSGGRPHRGVPTPHVQGRRIPGGVRPARKYELPK
jgi:RHS repeat-associated protein